MGIFVLGGNAEIKPLWGISDVDRLAAAAGGDEDLDVFKDGDNCPGKPWYCYRSNKHDATFQDENLTKRD